MGDKETTWFSFRWGSSRYHRCYRIEYILWVNFHFNCIAFFSAAFFLLSIFYILLHVHWIDNNEHELYQLVMITSIYFLGCMRTHPNCAFCILFVGVCSVRTNGAFSISSLGCVSVKPFGEHMQHPFPNFVQEMTPYRIMSIGLCGFVHMYIRILPRLGFQFQSSRVMSQCRLTAL